MSPCSHPARARLQARLRAFRASAGPVLPCLESLALLVDYGIRGARGILARSPGDAVRWAQQLGRHVALKVESLDTRHRRARNLVRLNVTSADDIRSTFEALMADARRSFPAADLRGILVQEMIQGDTEVAIDLRHEPHSGSMITVGGGGTSPGGSKDILSLPAPLTQADTEEMLRRGKGCSALVDALLGLSRLAEEADGAIATLEIDPLFVLAEGRGVIAVNASTILRGTTDD